MKFDDEDLQLTRQFLIIRCRRKMLGSEAYIQQTGLTDLTDALLQVNNHNRNFTITSDSWVCYVAETTEDDMKNVKRWMGKNILSLWNEPIDRHVAKE